MPSRAVHRLWFVLAAVMVFGMLAYLIWAHVRGLVSWTDVMTIEVRFAIAGAIGLVVGLLLRRRWSRRRDALRAYERTLAAIAAGDGD